MSFLSGAGGAVSGAGDALESNPITGLYGMQLKTVGAGMGLAGGMLGGIGNTDPNAGGAGLMSVTTPEQARVLFDQQQAALQRQRNFVDALQGQNGIQNQSDVYGQQQALATTLNQQAQGQGPNPAQAALAQQTSNNIAQQNALMAGQRGASQNAGLLARQSAMQGGNLQQQAVGQGATMQANQQIAAQQQLQQQQAMLGNTAQNQIQNYGTAAGNLSNSQLGLQANVLGETAARNNANVGQAGVNAQIAQGNAKNQAGMFGGLMNAMGPALQMFGGSSSGSSALGGLGAGVGGGAAASGGLMAGAGEGAGTAMSVAALAAHGGMATSHGMSTPGYASGGTVNGPRSNVGSFLSKAMPMRQGGAVPGQAKVQGDSEKNDTVPAMLSPGEVVIPRHIMQGKNAPEAAARFVAACLAKGGQ